MQEQIWWQEIWEEPKQEWKSEQEREKEGGEEQEQEQEQEGEEQKQQEQRLELLEAAALWKSCQVLVFCCDRGVGEVLWKLLLPLVLFVLFRNMYKPPDSDQLDQYD